MKKEKYDFEIEHLYSGDLPDNLKLSKTEEMELYFFTREVDKGDLDKTLDYVKNLKDVMTYYEFIGTGYMYQLIFSGMVKSAEELKAMINSKKENTYYALISPSLYNEEICKEERFNDVTAIFKVKCKVKSYLVESNTSKATLRI